LGSTNGTQVNGLSIAEAELKDGAEIRFGYVTGVFRNATASIDQAVDSQIDDKRDPAEQIRTSETQPIFDPRA